jgi:hypothetical protein
VLSENATAWRNAILLEAASNYSPAYRGIRTADTATTTERKYVEYSSGARELYDLEDDPYELRNRYRAATPPSGLVSRLDALKTCSADATAPAVTCQAAEDRP